MATTVLELLAELIHTHARRGRPVLIGMGGSQGSGKSYKCRELADARPGRIAHFSLDDVYLTKAERERMGRTRHALFRTRGAPGTHDLDLADRTIDRLRRARAKSETAIPAFDKLADDRAPQAAWPRFVGRPEAIIVEGWCMGALAPKDSPREPVNALEAEHDPNGRWRKISFGFLRGRYRRFHKRFDAMVYLRAPRWEIVRQWRGQQQEGLLGRPMTEEEGQALDHFIAHYERLTRAMLGGSHCARWIAHLDEARSVTRIEERA